MLFREDSPSLTQFIGTTRDYIIATLHRINLLIENMLYILSLKKEKECIIYRLRPQLIDWRLLGGPLYKDMSCHYRIQALECV